MRHCVSRHHEGHPRGLGGGVDGVCWFRRGGGLQQQLDTRPFGGPVCVPAPSSRGGGRGPARPGAAVLPRGGTREPQCGHGRA